MVRYNQIKGKGVLKMMKAWINGANKRVCDVSEDSKIVIIKIKGYKTQITANMDGTLRLENISFEG